MGYNMAKYGDHLQLFQEHSGGMGVVQVVLCRDRFLAGRDKLRLGSKNRDGSRQDLRQRKT